MCRAADTPGFRFIRKVIESRFDENPLESIRNSISRNPNNATKFSTYLRDLNPDMTVHPLYSLNKYYVPDYLRISFSRLRLMSHNLRIEIGRWSRIPTEQRVCVCDNGVVQTETHVLLHCPLTTCFRVKYQNLNFSNINDLLNENVNISDLCHYVHEVLNTFA